MDSRRARLEEWRKQKVAEQEKLGAKKNAAKSEVFERKAVAKIGTTIPRNGNVENAENTNPRQKFIRKNVTVAKKEKDDATTTNARRFQLEEWRKKKESQNPEKGSSDDLNRNITTQDPKGRRQTISNVAENRRQNLSKANNQITKQDRRQTFCVRPLHTQNNKKLPISSQTDKNAEVNSRRQTFEKKTATFTRKEKSDVGVKQGTVNQTRQTNGISGVTRQSYAVTGVARKPSVGSNRTFKPSIPNNAHKQNKTTDTQISVTRRTTFGASVRSRSTSSVASETENQQKPKRDDVEKKGKFIFVKSRIDTGLSNLKKNTNVSKPPNGKHTGARPKQVKAASKPKWNAATSKPPVPPPRPATVQHTLPRVPSPAKRRSCLAPSKRHVSPEKRRKTISALSESDASECSKIPLPITPARGHVRFLSPRIQATAGGTFSLGGSVNKETIKTSRLGTPCSKDMAMRAKLNAWLTARGKTPSRYRHLMCFHEDHGDSPAKNSDAKVDGGLTEAELSMQQEQLERESLVGSFIQSPMPGAGEAVAQDPAAKKLKCLLNECSLLLESGCPHQSVSEWLSEIERTMPSALQAAQYWVIKAELVEHGGGDNSTVIDVYEQAVRHHAAPPEEVADALSKFVQRMNSRKASTLLPTTQPVKEEVMNYKSTNDKPKPNTPKFFKQEQKDNMEKQSGVLTDKNRDQDVLEDRLLQQLTINENEEDLIDDVFESSSIRYCMTQATPFFKKLRAKADGLPTPHAKITPVRRSTRKSVSSLPPMLRDHDIVLESLDNISPGSKDKVIYQSNKALLEEFDSVANDED